jgi:hypothetical protein
MYLYGGHTTDKPNSNVIGDVKQDMHEYDIGTLDFLFLTLFHKKFGFFVYLK